MKINSDYQVLIVGGGTGGIMTAAQLKRKDKNLRVAIIEPREEHWYQPAWTLVGAGTYDFEKTIRPESTMIPEGVSWIKDSVTRFQPNENRLTTQSGKVISYDYLVISAGIQNDIEALPGLKEALSTDKVCSNYLDPRKTFRVLKEFKGGNAIFTQPATPIRCGGAPQKIMYLAEEFFRKQHIRDASRVHYFTPGSVIFGVKVFAEALNKIIRDRNIIFRTFLAPIRIDAENQMITFRSTHQELSLDSNQFNKEEGEKVNPDGTVSIHYDMLHIAPPQSAPDFIKHSTFAFAEGPNKGWMEADKYRLHHPVYENVYGIGDCVALPTAKTGAAIRKQAPVVVKSIINKLTGAATSDLIYEGYSSCPIVTGYDKMLLCEFKYDNVRDTNPVLGKLLDTSKPSKAMWYLKKYALPWMYWNLMMKGRM